MNSLVSCFLAGCLLAVAGAGCAPRAEVPAAPTDLKPPFDPASFSGTRAYEELESLLGRGLRDSGTPGAANAAQYLKERLDARGVKTGIDAFEEACPKGLVEFRNVVGRLPGRGKGLLIVGSHYDTKSGIGDGFEGANDSGSSTAVLVELAGVLAKGPVVDPEILLVLFDGEECMNHYGPSDGFHGSRKMARDLKEEGRAGSVLAMILLDMVGDRDLTVTIPRNSTPELVALAFDAAKEEGVRDRFSLYPFEIGDDHDPFLKARMPAINLIDFLYGSAPGRNDYWHTGEDRLDKISADSLAIAGRVTIRMLNRLVQDPSLSRPTAAER